VGGRIFEVVMTKQISIIVPMYNGEKYLRRCLDSIVGQTFGIEWLVLILLNDGSQDGTLTIAQQYADKFPDSVKVYSHKNMGTARTRNKGLRLARTKYVMFVDQDDYIDKDYCQTFYDTAERLGADVVAGGFRRTNGQKVFYTRRANSTAWYPYVHAEAWAKIHRTDFVKKSGAEFFNNIFGEDIPFTFQETLSMSKFATINYVGYNWFTNEASITHTVHRDFSRLNLPKLLEKLAGMSDLEMAQYYIFIVALYAFMVSNIRVSRQDFHRNLDEVFAEFQKVVPNFAGNKFLKTRINGCPIKTFMAAKIFQSFYKKGWYNLLYILYFVQNRRIMGK
jgi:glycosyltransferase involved in cell wall biosynthesis